MIKAILFDLDNTLVDFMQMKHACVEAAVTAMRDVGLKMSHQEATQKIYAIYSKHGIEYQEVFDRFLEEIHLSHPRFLAAAISAYRKTRTLHINPYPGVKETLLELIKRGIELGVVSDAPRKQAWLRLVDAGLDIFFNVVVAFEDTGKLKPNPEPFLMAMEKLHVLPTETIMIGDWPERDMRGAKALGLYTAFARYGTLIDETKLSGADFELYRLNDLIAIVDHLGVPVPIRKESDHQMNLFE
ncbi:MAG: HAD-IA family hydrolase [bacterium]|nr:HAD-IA family hydrolase [bacterium]